MDKYTGFDIVNRILKNEGLYKMNDSKTPNQLSQSLVMGALVMLTSASVITLMSLF